MPYVFDKFDRASLGPNWVTPGGGVGSPNGDHGPLAMISGLDGLELTTIGMEFDSAVYTAQSYPADEVFSEFEIIDELRFDTYQVYQMETAVNYVWLNAQLPSLNDQSGMRFGIWIAYGYAYTYPAGPYDDLGFSIVRYDNVGAPTFLADTYLPSEALFNENAIPVGTRVRFERRGNLYSGYIWTPHQNRWFLALTFTDSVSTGTYTGILGYSVANVANARVSNFKAGGRGDGFLGGGGWNLNDQRYNVLRTLVPAAPPTTNDMLFAWLATEGGTGNTLNDRWRTMCLSKGATPGRINDMWFQVLGLNGFTQNSLRDREFAFWLTDGALI